MAGIHAGSVGKSAEDTALAFLRDRGLELVCRNFRCRLGEIDLVMRDAGCLVFVEVRFRKSGRFASAAASVDHRKQRRLAMAAAMFLGLHPAYGSGSVRFDVLAIDGPSQSDSKIQWLRDAFRPPA